MLAASLTLSTLAGCQTPATPSTDAKTGSASSSPSTAKPSTPAANTTAPATSGTATTGAAAETKPGTNAPAAAPKAVADAGTELASALSAEREAEDLVLLADEGEAAKYRVLVVGAEKPKEGQVGITGMLDDVKDKAAAAKDKPELVKAAMAGAALARHQQRVADLRKAAFKAKLKADVKAKMDQRLEARKASAKPRLEKMADARGKMKEAVKAAKWVDNGDGTETTSVTIDTNRTANGKSMAGKRTMERTRRIEDKVLTSVVATFSHTGPQGGSYTMNRSKTLQEDGSYKVVFHAEMALPNGKTRVTDWEKTISADGAVSGTGTLVVKKGEETLKTINLTLSGSEKKEVAKAEDGKETAEVTLPEEGAPTAVVTDAAGKTEAVTIEAASDGTVVPAETSAV